LKRRKRQYRTRYQGVYARWRITQRSEATVRKRALRTSCRRSITSAEKPIVLGQQCPRRLEDLDGAVQFARTAVPPPGAQTADGVGPGTVDVVRAVAQHEQLGRVGIAQTLQYGRDHLGLRVARTVQRVTADHREVLGDTEVFDDRQRVRLGLA